MLTQTSEQAEQDRMTYRRSCLNCKSSVVLTYEAVIPPNLFCQSRGLPLGPVRKLKELLNGGEAEHCNYYDRKEPEKTR